MIALSIIFLVLSVAAYSISQLAQHKKLRLQDGVGTHHFFGVASYMRKYKMIMIHDSIIGSELVPVKAPNTWYYRFFKIRYKERFPLSTTLLVFLTDGYHLMQFIHHLLLACSLGLLFEIKIFDFNYNVQAMGMTWILIKFSHGIFYKIFSR